MSEPSNHDGNPVDRAMASLREMPIAIGPSPELQERTLAAIAARKRSRRRLLTAVWAAMILLCFGMIFIRYAYRSAVEEQARRIPRPAVINTPAPIPRVPIPIAPSPDDSHASIVAVASEGAVIGHVYFHGPRPSPKRIDLAACPQCAQVIDGPLFDDSLVVNSDGTLQNVVVSVSSGLPTGERFEEPVAPVMLDQKGCMFRPHVVAARVGQSVIVRNSDPMVHMVHSTEAEETPMFNFAEPTLAQRAVAPLQVVETFSVRCDLHPWMTAWIRVFNHPYFAVTRSDGSFEIKGLPPGEYRLKAWHESLGVREKAFTIRAGNGASVDFTFDAR